MKKLITLISVVLLLASCEKPLTKAESLDDYTYYGTSGNYEVGFFFVVNQTKVVGVNGWAKDFAADKIFIPEIYLIENNSTNPIEFGIKKNGVIIYKQIH